MKLNNVVIVLGKRLTNNQLSAEGISRVTALVAALKSLPVNNTVVIFCGGKTPGQNVAEADAMFSYFQRLNQSLSDPFPEHHILLENRSLNTMQNMRNTAEILCSSRLLHSSLPVQSPVNVILVSNDYHLERIIDIQTLMDEQGLLRALKSRCALMELELNIPLDIGEHISVAYPHKGALAEAFLLLDELTTYRVYLEGVINGVFKRDLSDVKAKTLGIAQRAIDKLQNLPLETEVHEQIEEINKAIKMTASNHDLELAKHALDSFHPILTALNSALDPDAKF